MAKSKKHISGRGAQNNPSNRFSRHRYEDETPSADDSISTKTRYLDVFPKTIVNKVTSPDVGMDYSLNPYQGCEHGCTYCYARPTHEYWGYSPGLDFERVIMIKKNAPDLLRQTLKKKNWSVKPIVLSGNTDCYQPCEREFELTRELLKVFLEFRHPVGIITKNVLIQRDFDIVEELASMNLIAVNLSITTLDEDTRRRLEPRTSTAAKKLTLVQELSDMNVPVNVMAAPIIPAINDHEVLAIAEAASRRGATNFHSHVVRLMGPNEEIFETWLEGNYPDRKSKVMNQLRSIHAGKTGSSTFGIRQRGEGAFALNLQRQLQIARNKFFPNPKTVSLRRDLFRKPSEGGQLDLFNG